MRIGIGGIKQESHSFTPAGSSLDRFKAGFYLRDSQVFEQLRGCNHEVGGALERADGITAVPLFFASPGSSGRPLDGRTLGHLQDQLLAAIDDGGAMHGLLLVMHGAMASEVDDDATGRILQSVRERVGPEMPIVATLDLHANVTRRMVDMTDSLVVYHTSPHIDQFDTGSRGMRLLRQIISAKDRPCKAFRSLPMVLPGENGKTTDGPYRQVMQEVARLEENPVTLAAAACLVQPWMDLPEYGSTVLVYTAGDQGLADREADRLAQLFWQVRHDFTPALVGIDEAISRAQEPSDRPLVFADSADAPSSGAPGDSTVVLKALLDAGFSQPALLTVVDRLAVDVAQQDGVGAVIELDLGARLEQRFYQPVRLTARVAALEEGTFRNETSGGRGVIYRMGGAAVLECGSLSVLVMSQPVVQWDPSMYRCVGLEPSTVRVVQVKSPAAFRQAYAPLAEDILMLDVPGVCSPNFDLFPWRRVRRPLFPLDDVQAEVPWQA